MFVWPDIQAHGLGDSGDCAVALHLVRVGDPFVCAVHQYESVQPYVSDVTEVGTLTSQSRSVLAWLSTFFFLHESHLNPFLVTFSHGLSFSPHSNRPLRGERPIGRKKEKFRAYELPSNSTGCLQTEELFIYIPNSYEPPLSTVRTLVSTV